MERKRGKWISLFAYLFLVRIAKRRSQHQFHLTLKQSKNKGSKGPSRDEFCGRLGLQQPTGLSSVWNFGTPNKEDQNEVYK